MKNKKDMSLHVPQRDKLKNKLELRQFEWTSRQQEFFKLALNKETKIIFVSGPAGTAKTLLAVYSSLELMNQRRVSDMIYIRAAVESAHASIGYLPGEVQNKMAFYGIPFMDKLEELLHHNDIDILKKERRLDIQPVNYIRGQSWNARVAIVDEAQNMTLEEIFTILTRVGKFSKCFVLADTMQNDLFHKEDSGFDKAARNFADENGAHHGVFKFVLAEEDIMRDELTKYLVKRYQSMK